MYPNPFTEKTTIAFSVAETQEVVVELFDISGKKVAIPFEGLAAKQVLQQVNLDRANLPKGIYILKLIGEKGLQQYHKVRIE